MSLQDRLEALRSGSDTRLPLGHRELYDHFLADLARSGLADSALKAGDRLPEFLLPDTDGVLVDSAELLARGPLVISFFRGHWCPYCNAELQALEDDLARIERLGATLVAVTPELGSEVRRLKQLRGLRFRVLSDPDNALGMQFGVVFPIPAPIKAAYLELGIPFDRLYGNGNASWLLPVPATFVIGTDGIIRHAHVDTDYRRRMEPAAVIRVLEGLGA